jgi:4-hydroxy-tetrahydrodipicolinate synthase
MFETLKDRLDGPFYTIFTPFDKQESVDYEVLEKYLTLLYKQGARKFYAMAYNSRYSQLTHGEILELNGFCVKTLKAIDQNNIVIVGDPIHCSTKASLEFTEHAKESGADLISLIMREKYFTDDQVLEHFDIIGRASNFPLLVHEMPFLSGFDGSQMHWPQSLLQRLPEIPQIAALKEDAKDFEVACQAFKLEPNIRVILAGGGKARFREFFSRGARSWLNGISIIDASIAEEFWKAMLNNDVETQDFIIDKLEVPFFGGVTKKYGWHRTNKALLQAAGLMHRRDRMPLKHLSDDEFLDVVEVYKQVQASWDAFREAKV